jgi:hypothetical protein
MIIRDHCRFLVLPGSVQLSQYYQFVAQADNVRSNNTAGLWLEPTFVAQIGCVALTNTAS